MVNVGINFLAISPARNIEAAHFICALASSMALFIAIYFFGCDDDVRIFVAFCIVFSIMCSALAGFVARENKKVSWEKYEMGLKSAGKSRAKEKVDSEKGKHARFVGISYSGLMAFVAMMSFALSLL